jgi:hypothetical protein
MRIKIPLRMILSSLVGVSQGLLLAWTLTLERSTSNQLFALASVMGLLFVVHVFSSRMFRRSILIITSYLEGLFLFIVTMTSFRIGDHLLGITTLSFRTEIFLFSVAVVFGFFYVWTMKRVVKE